jgi:hypothetical protein
VDDSSTSLWSVVASSSADEVDRRAAVWGTADLLIKVVVERTRMPPRWG